MPSNSLKEFFSNLVDVRRLIKAHEDLNPPGKGKRALGHITRSGIVMLCASWEHYAESLLVEAIAYLVSGVDHPDELPKQVRKHLSKKVKESKHELKPLELAGDGWRSSLLEFAKLELSGVNTPKSGVLNPLYLNYLGLENMSDCWSLGNKHVNEFVSVRGDIAHKGRKADYIAIGDLRTFASQFVVITSETDNYICEHLKASVNSKKQPWKRQKINP